MSVQKRPIVGVMGSGAVAHEALSVPLGQWLAQAGMHLLTGGGGGVMAAVSKAFVAVKNRQGLSLGILPAASEIAKGTTEIYPNPWIEIPVKTHLPLRGEAGKAMLSRNHINILTADVVVALPGGAGTQSEIELAMHYKKPLVVFEGMNPASNEHFVRAKSLEEVQEFVLQTIANLNEK